MGMRAAVGSFSIVDTDVLGSTQKITLPFQPKFIRFTVSGNNGVDVVNQTHHRLVSLATSPTQRGMIANTVEHNLAVANAIKGYREDAIVGLINPGGSWQGLADLDAILSDGFRIIIDQVFGKDILVSYLALGGGSLTDAFVGSFKTNNTFGLQTVPGVGFQGDFATFLGTGTAASPGPSISSSVGGCLTGFMVNGAQQGYVSPSSQDAVSTTNTKAACHQGDEAHTRVNTNGTVTNRFAFSSFNSDGFVIDNVEENDDVILYAVLKGGDYNIQEVDTRTDTADIVVTGLASRPSAGIVISAMAPEDAVDIAHDTDAWTDGVWTASGEQVNAILDRNAQATSSVTTAGKNNAVYVRTGNGTIEGLMSRKSIEPTGATFVMDDPDAFAVHTVMAFFGPEPATAALTGTVTAAISEDDIRAGGETIILTLTNDTWLASGSAFNGQRQAIIAGLVSDGVEVNGWNAVVVPLIAPGQVVRTSDTVVTITLPIVPAYDIDSGVETITATIPASALVTEVDDVVAAPTFDVGPVAMDPIPAMSTSLRAFAFRRLNGEI